VDRAAAVIAWPVIALAEELLLAVSDFWLEQAERPRIATALRPAATIAVQCLGFMTVSLQCIRDDASRRLRL
jgi:hypothetical protein